MLEGSRWTTAQNRWTERLEALGSKITRQFNHPYFRHTSFLCCCKYTKSIILPVSEQGTRNHSPLASLLPKTFTLGWFDLFFLLHLPQMCVCVFMPYPFLTSLHTHTGLHSASVFLCTCQGRDCTGARPLPPWVRSVSKPGSHVLALCFRELRKREPVEGEVSIRTPPFPVSSSNQLGTLWSPLL